MDTARDWHWVPAYTDPCRDDRFFADWKGPDGERGFTLDPKTFGSAGQWHFHFGTRKIGDPQFRGAGRKALLLDYPAENAPEKLTVRLIEPRAGPEPDRVHRRGHTARDRRGRVADDADGGGPVPRRGREGARRTGIGSSSSC